MKKGFTILEIVISLAAMAGFLFTAMTVFRFTSSNSARSGKALEVDTKLFQAMGQIGRIGRMAESCTKTGTAGAAILTCRTYTSRAAGAPLDWVRFALNSEKLQYLKDTTGAGTFATSQVLIEYPGIYHFDACDDADMVTPGTCPILGLALTTAHNSNIGARANRFFRYQIQAYADPETPSNQKLLAQQNAFFIRNPLSLAGMRVTQ